MRSCLLCLVLGLGSLSVVGVNARPSILGLRIAREVGNGSTSIPVTSVPLGTNAATQAGKPASSSSSPSSFVPKPKTPAPSSKTNATVITIAVCLSVAIVVAVATTLVSRWYRKRKRLRDKKPEAGVAEVEEGVAEDDDDDSEEEDDVVP